MPIKVKRLGCINERYMSDEVYELRPGYYKDGGLNDKLDFPAGTRFRLVSGENSRRPEVIGLHWFDEITETWWAVVLEDDISYIPYGIPKKHLRRVE